MWIWVKARPVRSFIFLFWLVVIPMVLNFGPWHGFCHHTIRGMGFAIGLGIAVAFIKPAWQWFTSPIRLTTAHELATGIWLLAVGIMGHMVMNIIAQFSDNPPAVVHSAIAVISMWVSLSGGILILLSSEGVDHGVVLERSWMRLGVLVALAVFVAFMVGYYIETNEWWHQSYWKP